MKKFLLFFSFFIFTTFLFSQKYVEINGSHISVENGYLVFESKARMKWGSRTEVWKLNDWKMYKLTKNRRTYYPISTSLGKWCNDRPRGNWDTTPPSKGTTKMGIKHGWLVVRVVYDYKNKNLRKEHIEWLDNRSEAQINGTEEVFEEKKVSVNDFILTAIKPNTLILTEPTYNESLILEIWEKKAWSNHLNKKKHNNHPRFSKVSNGNAHAGRKSRIRVVPGNYVMNIDLLNKTTGERTFHQKILNTEIAKPNEIHGDGFSLKITTIK